MIRQHIRFPPDALAYAEIDWNGTEGDFRPEVVGLIENESYTGAALVVISENPIQTDQVLRLKVGQIGPLSARVVWASCVEGRIYRFGIQYAE